MDQPNELCLLLCHGSLDRPNWVLHHWTLSLKSICIHTIRQYLSENLCLWHFERCIFIILHDAIVSTPVARNMVTQMRPVCNGQFFHGRCVCPLINLCVQDGIKRIFWICNLYTPMGSLQRLCHPKSTRDGDAVHGTRKGAPKGTFRRENQEKFHLFDVMEGLQSDRCVDVIFLLLHRGRRCSAADCKMIGVLLNYSETS